MLTFDEDILKEVQELAGLCFDLEQVAMIVGADPSAFIKTYNEKSTLYYAYQRGALIYEAKVRKSIFELAKGGSSTSQSEYMKLKDKRDNKLLKRQ